jgi:RNA polymerase sigma-70 factor (ECF subfamily)
MSGNKLRPANPLAAAGICFSLRRRGRLAPMPYSPQCNLDDHPADDADAASSRSRSAAVQEGRRMHEGNRMLEGEVASDRPTREDEFITLLTHHKHQLFNLIFCMVQSLPDTEDVFQQTTMALWNKFDDFQLGTDFAAWASRVARYRALNFIRSKRRERVLFSEGLIAQLAECRFDSAELQDARLRALAACREKLSQADQMLLSVCYGREGTIRESAKLIGRPVGSVYDSLSRIRAALYDCIGRTLSREGHL